MARTTNYLQVELCLEALKNSARGTILTRISADLILLLVVVFSIAKSIGEVSKQRSNAGERASVLD